MTLRKDDFMNECPECSGKGEIEFIATNLAGDKVETTGICNECERGVIFDKEGYIGAIESQVVAFRREIGWAVEKLRSQDKPHQDIVKFIIEVSDKEETKRLAEKALAEGTWIEQIASRLEVAYINAQNLFE